MFSRLDPASSPGEDSGSSFSFQRFRDAIEDKGDLDLAKKELDCCFINDDEVAQVYSGDGTGIRKTPLFVILQPRWAEGVAPVDTHKLLDHPVMQLVIALKWQRFGLRKYMEQLFVYALLLLTMTCSIALHTLNIKVFQGALALWLYLVSVILVGLVATQFFNYTKRLAWGLYTLSALLIVLVGLSQLMHQITQHAPKIWFLCINDFLLVAASLYLISCEYRELASEFSTAARTVRMRSNSTLKEKAAVIFFYTVKTPIAIIKEFVLMLFGLQHAKYFDSNFNKVQMPIYCTLLVYVGFELISPWDETTRMYFGITVLVALWILSLEFLELHGTAGYLIPMIAGMLGDVANFLIFYAPFQGAFTCAYYLLFQHHNEPGYSTLSHCFVTTLLVMFGQIDIEPFENLANTPTYILGYILLLAHATIVLVMLLNVLVAMMAKTVDGGLDIAKLQASVSFAQCVLRSEKNVGLKPLPRCTIFDLPMPTKEDSLESPENEQLRKEIQSIKEIATRQAAKIDALHNTILELLQKQGSLKAH